MLLKTSREGHAAAAPPIRPSRKPRASARVSLEENICRMMTPLKSCFVGRRPPSNRWWPRWRECSFLASVFGGTVVCRRPPYKQAVSQASFRNLTAFCAESGPVAAMRERQTVQYHARTACLSTFVIHVLFSPIEQSSVLRVLDFRPDQS